MEKIDDKENKKSASGYLFVGCMFLGMAAGWFTGKFIIGLFAGMGIGFLLSAAIMFKNGNKN